MIFDPSQSSGSREPHPFFVALMTKDWEQPGGPFEFNTDLTLAELAGASHFHNVRSILRALAAADGAPATATGCFNRAFAVQMLAEFQMPEKHRKSMRRVCKVINESDVPDLQMLRALCEVAGLIALRQKRFRLTRRGREHLADDLAGALYRRLFLTLFRKLDLRSLFPLRNVPGIQHTLAVTLWRLDAVARDWTPIDRLAALVLLPRVLDELRATKYPHDTDEWILNGYVLDPLCDFGLIEKRERPTRWPGLTETDSIRLTALWQRFVRFSPQG
jgi:hypothetical protein